MEQFKGFDITLKTFERIKKRALNLRSASELCMFLGCSIERKGESKIVERREVSLLATVKVNKHKLMFWSAPR